MEIKERIALRWLLVINGMSTVDCVGSKRVRKKKPAVWSEIAEKVNIDFNGSKKVLAFVRRKTKDKKSFYKMKQGVR